MRAFKNLALVPVGVALTADDVLEFHAARLLLVMHLCGRRGTLKGLTKLAKLDFFVRYPSFFREVLHRHSSEGDAVESAMVRHHYGPWDHRYYHVLAYLEAKTLVTVAREGRGFTFTLTAEGMNAATRLSSTGIFAELVEHIRTVGEAAGGMTGNQLKQLIYAALPEQVADRSLGEVIR